MVNLRRALQARILDGMIRKIGGTSWKVLVVDREALRILAAGVRLNELSKEGVTVVEMLDLRREPLPRIPAIYFVSPNPETIQLLISENKKQYKEFHVFFTRRVPDFQMDLLKRAGSFLRKVKTFIELEVEFLVYESSAFSLDRPGCSLPQLFGGDKKEKLNEATVLSERLAEVCKLVGVDGAWTVRYDAISPMTKRVASLVKEQIEAAQLERRGETNDKDMTGTERKYTLLVVDRTADLISPLLHEFTYQAMAHDLLPLDYRKPGGAHYEIKKNENEKEVAGGSKNKKLPLEDEDGDELWYKVRHMHVEEARGVVRTALQTFIENDPAAKVHAQQDGQRDGPLDIKDLSAAIRALPAYKDAIDRHELHISAIQECLSRFRSDHLDTVAGLEQDLAMGRDAEGVRIKGDLFLDQLEAFLSNPDVGVRDKCRIVLMTAAVGEGEVSLGGEVSLLSASNSYKRQLNPPGAAALAKMTSSMNAALQGLQIIIREVNMEAQEIAKREKASNPANTADEDRARSLQKLIKIKDKYKERKVKKRRELARRLRHGINDDLPYALSRYIPPLRAIALDLVDGEMKNAAFPVCGGVSVDAILASLGNSTSTNSGIPSYASSVGSFGHSFSTDSTESLESVSRRVADPNHVFVVFYVGGVCYSEIRTIHEVQTKRKANIIIGGSQLLTPQMFVDALAAVADPTIRLKVMMPPLPIELAQTKMAKKLETVAVKKVSHIGDEKDDGEAQENDEHAPENPIDSDYVVVESYEKKSLKKSLGGMFGRKKKAKG